MASLSNRTIADGAGASQLVGDIAVTAVALLVRGAEFASLAGPILRDATGADPVVTSLGGAFAMRRTARSERSVASGTLTGDLSACDGAETGAALLVRGAEIVCVASAILRHTTGADPVVTSLGAALLMRYALLAKRSIIPRAFAGVGARRNVAETGAALLVRGTKFPAFASSVLRHTTCRWPVIAAHGATLLMRGARHPERFRRL
jgi:hypothetical protein